MPAALVFGHPACLAALISTSYPNKRLLEPRVRRFIVGAMGEIIHQLRR